MIDGIAAVGDAGDINCWSGIPYHFTQAARPNGWKVEPWRLQMSAFDWPRRLWNLRQFLCGRGVGGFQYSGTFARQALRFLDFELHGSRVLSFNQHFPPATHIVENGGKLCLFLDATFPLLLDRYGLAASLPAAVQKKCLEAEREAFQKAEWLVFFQRWSAESAMKDCGADPAKVRVICPGANLRLPENWGFEYDKTTPDETRPLVLGFIGKDWKRKGLPFLVEVRKHLVASGLNTVIRCAGGVPEELTRDGSVDHWGFINKHTNGPRFFEFLRGCDLGCLFSTSEASSIAVLEFLHAGIPVAGFTVDGMVDLFPPDAGFRFDPSATAEKVAMKIGSVFRDQASIDKLRDAAQSWSPLVTWERCVREWQELLSTGTISSPVQPWRGLAAMKVGVQKGARDDR